MPFSWQRHCALRETTGEYRPLFRGSTKREIDLRRCHWQRGHGHVSAPMSMLKFQKQLKWVTEKRQPLVSVQKTTCCVGKATHMEHTQRRGQCARCVLGRAHGQTHGKGKVREAGQLPRVRMDNGVMSNDKNTNASVGATRRLQWRSKVVDRHAACCSVGFLRSLGYRRTELQAALLALSSRWRESFRNVTCRHMAKL